MSNWRPKFAMVDAGPGAPLLDLNLAGVPTGPYVVPSGTLASLSSAGDLVWEIRFTPSAIMLASTTHLCIFEATTPAGSFSLIYTAQDSEGSAANPDAWSLFLTSSHVTGIGSNTGNASPGVPGGASGLVGDDVRVYVVYLATANTWGVGITVNGVGGAVSQAAIPAGGAVVTPITAMTLGSKIDTTLPLAAQFTRLRVYQSGGAVRNWTGPTGLCSGDSITAAKYILGGGQSGAVTRIYSPSESASFVVPRVVALACPGDAFATQTARFNACPWVACGSIKWVYIQLVNNDAEAGASYATCVSRYNTYIALIRAALPNAKILCGISAPAKGYSGWGGGWTVVAAVNASLLAGGVILCDYVVSSHYALMGDAGGLGADYLKPSLDTGDALHPNDAGVAIVGAAIRAELNALGLS